MEPESLKRNIRRALEVNVKMKLTEERLDYMSERVKAFLKANPGFPAIYLSGDFPRASKVKNLEVRFLFDLFYAAGLATYTSQFRDLTDAHILTGMRRVAKELNLPLEEMRS